MKALVPLCSQSTLHTMGPMARFDPEKIAVYRLARQHTRAVRDLIASTNTRGFADLVGQLRQSTASIPANVLEATGEWRPGKRLNYLMIAKGSAFECWAHVDTMVDLGLVTNDAIREVRELQHQITALLITMIRNLETEIAHNTDPLLNRPETDESELNPSPYSPSI
jgi:four helix bundle protein